jgi:hypothetical protein
LFTFGRNNFGPGFPCCLSFGCHRPLKLQRQSDVFSEIFVVFSLISPEESKKH